MDLKDFIAETLTQIVDGVVEAQSRAAQASNGARVSPYLDPMADLVSKHGLLLAGGDSAQFVQFDVALTTKEGTGTKGGAGLFVGPVTLGTSAQSNAESTGSSRVTFRVPLVLPRS